MNKKAVLVIAIAVILGILALLGPTIYRLTFKSILDFDKNENNSNNATSGEAGGNTPVNNDNNFSNFPNTTMPFAGGGGGGGNGGGAPFTSPASDITRNFSSSTINLGENLTVTLNIHLRNSEAFYVLEDQIPNGLQVVDSGVGNTSTPNYIKWIEYQNPQAAAYIYVLNATQRGTYTFIGEYFIEGLPGIILIGGSNTIDVI